MLLQLGNDVADDTREYRVGLMSTMFQLEFHAFRLSTVRVQLDPVNLSRRTLDQTTVALQEDVDLGGVRDAPQDFDNDVAGCGFGEFRQVQRRTSKHTHGYKREDRYQPRPRSDSKTDGLYKFQHTGHRMSAQLTATFVIAPETALFETSSEISAGMPRDVVAQSCARPQLRPGRP